MCDVLGMELAIFTFSSRSHLRVNRLSISLLVLLFLGSFNNPLLYWGELCYFLHKCYTHLLLDQYNPSMKLFEYDIGKANKRAQLTIVLPHCT